MKDISYYFVELTKYSEKEGLGEVIDTKLINTSKEVAEIKDSLQIHEDITDEVYVEVWYLNEDYKPLDFQYTTFKLVENTFNITIN